MTELIERKALLLYETVEMLYKYINGISFHDIAESMAHLYGSAPVFRSEAGLPGADYPGGLRRAAGAKPTDAAIFRRFETDAVRDNLCLAKVMTLSFFCTNFRIWTGKQMLSKHVGLKCSGMASRLKE